MAPVENSLNQIRAVMVLGPLETKIQQQAIVIPIVAKANDLYKVRIKRKVRIILAI